jgi:hypothetical protein
MTTRQEAAVKALRTAFAQAKKAGLLFWGVDNELLAIPRKVCPINGSSYEPLTENERIYNEYGVVVIAGDPYIDSGGW